MWKLRLLYARVLSLWIFYAAQYIYHPFSLEITVAVNVVYYHQRRLLQFRIQWKEQYFGKYKDILFLTSDPRGF